MSTAVVNPEVSTARQKMPPMARALYDVLAKLLSATQKVFTAQRAQKQLRVCESVSLGDKRFVAVIQVDQERFLIGGATNSIAMLTRLQETASFAPTMKGLTEEGSGPQ
jgi:flagellar biogenesis protein FliO